jgi:mannose-6-phosphate isomerase-like protein (cupin superfamily)
MPGWRAHVDGHPLLLRRVSPRPPAAGGAADADRLRSVRVARMAGYAIKRLEHVPDAFGDDYPGEMRFLTTPLDNEQVAFTYRRMTPQTGGKGSYGHRHKTQEEIYFLISGRVQFKLDDDVVDVEGGTAVRVSPEVARSIWNDGPEDAELVICSVRVDDPEADAQIVEDFWPE